MKRLLFVAALMLNSAAEAAPSIPGTTVASFLPSCEAMLTTPESPAADACAFYMAGVGDAFTSHLLQPLACAPPGVYNMDVIRAFVAWGRQNPEFRSEHVFRGVMAALREAYPCPMR